MNKKPLLAALALAGASLIVATPLCAAELSVPGARADAGSLVTEVGRRHVRPGGVVVVRPAIPRGPRRVIVREWHHRPHYGNIIAGIAIGTIIAAAVANAAPPPPRDDLCWYWTNRAHTHGYWDYCE